MTRWEKLRALSYYPYVIFVTKKGSRDDGRMKSSWCGRFKNGINLIINLKEITGKLMIRGLASHSEWLVSNDDHFFIEVL